MDAQDKELAQLKSAIENDVKSLVDKYMSIIGLDVPENNEADAHKKILKIVKDTISEIEENY